MRFTSKFVRSIKASIKTRILAMAEGDKLANRISIITGGANGLGLATAKLFANDGGTVHIFD
jgi:hypothetical protein